MQMKLIPKKDLIVMLQRSSDYDLIDIEDFEYLLDVYGDDYFVVDGIFRMTKENEERKKWLKEG
jgi:hypothetical protein